MTKPQPASVTVKKLKTLREPTHHAPLPGVRSPEKTFSARLQPGRPIVALIASLLAGFAGASRAQEAPVPAINTQSRQAVLEAWSAYYRPSAAGSPSLGLRGASETAVDTQWTGNVEQGVAGTTASAFRQAVLRRVNWYRAMACLPGNVVFSETSNGYAQAAALLMSRNKALSHTPPTSWFGWNQTAYDGASSSSLFLGAWGSGAVDGYIEDGTDGIGNVIVGHRRWILFPPMRKMGTGDVPARSDGTAAWPAANALRTFGEPDSWAADVYSMARNRFTTWPPAGYVPVGTTYAYWTISYPGPFSPNGDNVSFAQASITARKNGQPLRAVVLSNNEGYRGFGDDTFVWWFPGDVRAAEDTYEVTVSNIQTPQGTLTYAGTTTLIDSDPAKLVNVSTRLRVGSGDNVGIVGFVIAGSQPQRVVIRALGPSLTAAGVAGVLSNPALVVRDAAGALVAQNDDWQTQIAGAPASRVVDIASTSFAPSNPREAAVALALLPGAYTAIISGVGGETGVALVEVYDLDPANSTSRAVNVSTRGRVVSGDGVMIGGFVIRGGTAPRNVLVRALGPSLAAAGVTDVLADPTLEVRNAAGQLVAAVDDYDQSASSLAQLGSLRPSDPREAAVRLSLFPGAYTAIVRGARGQTGVALVEGYEVP